MKDAPEQQQKRTFLNANIQMFSVWPRMRDVFNAVSALGPPLKRGEDGSF